MEINKYHLAGLKVAAQDEPDEIEVIRKLSWNTRITKAEIGIILGFSRSAIEKWINTYQRPYEKNRKVLRERINYYLELK